MFSTRKKSDTYREHWGYSFHLTDQHLSREDIDSLRSSYDTLGATALERLQALASRIKPSQGSKGKPDLYAILRDHHQEDEVLSQFWDAVQFVPEWVDWKQLERGQKVFARYLVAYSTAFALQGFIRENAVGLNVRC